METARSRSSKKERCSFCSKRADEIGNFLETVHTGTAITTNSNLETTNLARNCLADFLEIMPWKMWLKAPKRDTPQRLSGFRRKVVDSLETVIRITLCTFLRCDEASMESIARLASNIFTEIPFNEDKLVQAAIDLWSTLANSIANSTTAPKIQDATISVLVTSMGGRVTPQGDLLPMCVPAHDWLSKQSSIPFLGAIFDSIESNDNLSQRSIKLLSAMLRTRPETAYVLWERFQGLVRNYTASDSSEAKLVCVGLLESFMLGRRDFQDGAEDRPRSTILLELLCSVLEKTRDENHVQCRYLSFNTYAALVTRDWILIDTEGDRLFSHFNAIVSHCREPNAKVRSAACKAIGDFCTQYLSPETNAETDEKFALESQFKMISHEVCATMLESLDDKNASVRSMALFSLGNLAYALREINQSLLLEVPTLLRVCVKIQQILDDSNDKVAGNAIRSIGHWVTLLACSDSKSETIEKNELLRLVLESLSAKVSNTLEIVSNEKKGSLSWKQRSVAKKHGWGACHSLAQLFQAMKGIDDPALIASCSAAVRKLILCVEHFSSLNEKVAISAMAALREMEPLQFAEVAGKTGLIGEALATCTIQLYEAQTQQKVISPKVLKERQLLLLHLLISASILDAYVVLKRDDFSKPTLDFLYGWMVENDVDGRAFEIFALALQRPGLISSDVSLEQNFASRALQQYKKDQSLLTVTNDYDVDDGADEL